MSHAQLGRIERAEVASASVEQLALACSAVGLRLVAKAVPAAGPAMDGPQLRVLDRFGMLLPEGTPFWREVPLPVPGDLRAWDALIVLAGERVAVEAETRLADVQDLDRRCQLKLRDGGVDLLVLLVNDTTHNREFLDAHREALRSTFPLDGRQILRAVRTGRAPRANGLVVL
jgi:hypothetical protein